MLIVARDARCDKTGVQNVFDSTRATAFGTQGLKDDLERSVDLWVVAWKIKENRVLDDVQVQTPYCRRSSSCNVGGHVRT